MSDQNLKKLATLIETERDALLALWRTQVRQLPSAQHLDTPTLNDHIPQLIAELAHAFKLKLDQTIPQGVLEGTPPSHGIQRYADGFDIVEVVAEYNILRACIYDLAEQHGLELQGSAFHILNRLLDEAIGMAVQTFATQQGLAVQRRREEYLSFVAHDLRTPLSAISLAARVLELTHDGRGDRAEIPRMLKTLHRNVLQLQQMVEKVLKENDHMLTRSGVKLECRDVDLWPAVEALILDLQPLADTASTRLINAVPEDQFVYADASSLRRILQNLITNAIKYTPRGEITIGAKPATEPSGVECWVSDNGAGVPKERLDLIFDKLETDPDMEGGNGLGLAIVKTFVEAHGGTVSVQSIEGVGTTFRFILPARVT